MSQGTTVKGITASGLNKEIRVDDDGAISGASLATRLDDTSTLNMTYIGKATAGTLNSASTWQIARLDTSTGLTKTWADGDSQFNNVWNDRVSLSYL